MSDRPLSQRIANLKELSQMLAVSAQIQVETAAVLDELSVRLYSCEEDRNRLLATVRSQDQEIKSLNTRYSDLLYQISAMRNKQ